MMIHFLRRVRFGLNGEDRCYFSLFTMLSCYDHDQKKLCILDIIYMYCNKIKELIVDDVTLRTKWPRKCNLCVLLLVAISMMV